MRILLTFPVTACSSERGISVESYHRTTQTDARITGLCLLCSYREFDIDWESVVNTFATENVRRMALINIMDYGKLNA